jgi:leukotriene-A4 hydrolase
MSKFAELNFMSHYFKHFLILLISSAFFSSCSHKEIKVMPEIKLKNHSYSNFDSITIKHVHLDLKVDFDKKRLSGKAVLDIVNSSKCHYLILDTRHLDIQKVKLEDSFETAWSMTEEQNHFGQALVIELTQNTRSVAVYYKTQPEAEALMWLEPEQTFGKKHPFMFTQSQAILARTWMPCMDVPSMKMTYSADIHCDKKYMALMSAENTFENNNKGVYHFEMPQPVPSYLFALSVGNIEFRSLGDNCGVYAEPEMIEKSAYEFQDLSQMIQSAEELYGPYAWGRYDIFVLPPSFPFGGMENPRLTFATPTIIAGDKSLVSLVAHELAHSWSGNLVTNSTWDDFWLNEGFTVYFEERIMEKIYGKDYADMLAKLSLEELKLTLEDFLKTAPGDTKLKLNLSNRNPDDGVSDIAYVKGCMFLRYLESQVGRTAWDAFLKQYFNHFKWKSIDTETFITYLNEHLLSKYKNLNLNINEWIYEIGLPKNCPNIESLYLIQVEKSAQLLNLKKDPKALDTSNYTTHHWLHLFRNLNHDSIKNIMTEMDALYQLSNSQNAEIQCDWYRLCIKNSYTAAYPQIENYLIQVGRRKFLKPLYEALIETPEGLDFAKRVFEKAKRGYHSVSRNSIELLLYETESNNIQ